MRSVKLFAGLFLCFIFFFNVRSENSFERPITIITTSYNNKDWYKNNLDMLFSQNYSNYKVIYIDDCSPDGTGDLVEQYIKEKGQEYRVTLIKNKERMFKMYNFYHAVHDYCNDEDIVFDYDGDDWFAHEHVLEIINLAYADSNVWLTYGRFRYFPENGIGLSRQIPKKVIRTSSYRDYEWVTSHQRTFYAWLFKIIKKEDFMCQGEFIKAATDLASMFPMLEMADGRFKFIQDFIYIYNIKTSQSVNKTMRSVQGQMSTYIRKRPRYKRLESS